MAVPKRRKSPSKQGMRRSHDALVPMNLTVCPHCKQAVPPHKVCGDCGVAERNGVLIQVVKKPKFPIKKQD